MDENKSINQRIAEIRTERGFTQQHLADALSLKLSSYSQLEREGTISAIRLLIIAKTLNVHPMDLLVGENERELYDIKFPYENERNPFEPSENTLMARQHNIFEPIELPLNEWEKANFKTIHQLKNEYKTQVFELANSLYEKKK